MDLRCLFTDKGIGHAIAGPMEGGQVSVDLGFKRMGRFRTLVGGFPKELSLPGVMQQFQHQAGPCFWIGIGNGSGRLAIDKPIEVGCTGAGDGAAIAHGIQEHGAGVCGSVGLNHDIAAGNQWTDHSGIGNG